jgi:hypothetical protein
LDGVPVIPADASRDPGFNGGAFGGVATERVFGDVVAVDDGDLFRDVRGMLGISEKGWERTYVALVNSGVTSLPSNLGIAAESLIAAGFAWGCRIGALVHLNDPRASDSHVGIISRIDRATTLGRDGSDIRDSLSDGRNGQHRKQSARKESHLLQVLVVIYVKGVR